MSTDDEDGIDRPTEAELAERDDYSPCSKCGTQIPDSADRCRECGYEGYKDTPAQGWNSIFMIGCVLSFLLVTAPIGIPLMILGALGVLWCKWRRPHYYQPQIA